MSDREQPQEQELKQLFRALNSPLSNRDFVRDVMRRATRYARIRRFTLATSATIGLAISVGAFVQLANRLQERLVFVGMHWAEYMRSMEAQIVAAVILCAVVLPCVLRRLSR